MPSAVTAKLIEGLKRTTDRIDDFLNTNRQYFGDIDPSPYTYMIFCSFLVTASFAPGKEHFPNTSVEREASETEEFKRIIIQTIAHSILQRQASAIELMKSDAEKDDHAARTEQQVEALFDEKQLEYFRYFQMDIEQLAEGKGLYNNLSTAFIRDVLGKADLPEAGQAAGQVSLGLCLSTTVSGLLAFFEGP